MKRTSLLASILLLLIVVYTLTVVWFDVTFDLHSVLVVLGIAVVIVGAFALVVIALAFLDLLRRWQEICARDNANIARHPFVEGLARVGVLAATAAVGLTVGAAGAWTLGTLVAGYSIRFVIAYFSGRGDDTPDGVGAETDLSPAPTSAFSATAVATGAADPKSASHSSHWFASRAVNLLGTLVVMFADKVKPIVRDLLDVIGSPVLRGTIMGTVTALGLWMFIAFVGLWGVVGTALLSLGLLTIIQPHVTRLEKWSREKKTEAQERRDQLAPNQTRQARSP